MRKAVSGLSSYSSPASTHIAINRLAAVITEVFALSTFPRLAATLLLGTGAMTVWTALFAFTANVADK